MRITLLAAGLSFCLSGIAHAGMVYECQINVSKNNGFVPNWVDITFDPATQTATAFDPFINHYSGEPLAAEVSVDNAKRLTIAWEFANIKGKHGATIVNDRTRATIVKSTNKITITSTQSSADPHSGFGTCKLK